MNLLEAVKALKQGKKVRRAIDKVEIRYAAGRVKVDSVGTLPMIAAWLDAKYELMREE